MENLSRRSKRNRYFIFKYKFLFLLIFLIIFLFLFKSMKHRSKLTNLKVCSQIDCYNGNNSWIREELGYFLRCIQNLIKLDNEKWGK